MRFSVSAAVTTSLMGVGSKFCVLKTRNGNALSMTKRSALACAMFPLCTSAVRRNARPSPAEPPMSSISPRPQWTAAVSASSLLESPSTSIKANVLPITEPLWPSLIWTLRRRAISVARLTPGSSATEMTSLRTRKPVSGKAMRTRPPCIMPRGPTSPAVEQPEIGTSGKADCSAPTSNSGSCSIEKKAMMCWKRSFASSDFAAATLSLVDASELANTRIPHAAVVDLLVVDLLIVDTGNLTPRHPAYQTRKVFGISRREGWHSTRTRPMSRA